MNEIVVGKDQINYFIYDQINGFMCRDGSFLHTIVYYQNREDVLETLKRHGLTNDVKVVYFDKGRLLVTNLDDWTSENDFIFRGAL